MYGVLTGGLLTSDFEISYVSDSVVLELSVADFYVVDCLCEEIIFEGFPAVVCIVFASPLVMFFDVSLILYGFSASVELLLFPIWSRLRL